MSSKINGNGTATSSVNFCDKDKKWQVELLMERLRSKQHRTFQEMSKSMRMSLLEKRYALDHVEKANLQKCLDSMQHCIKVTTRQGLVERLESLTRQLGLKFMEDKSGLFISSDMFYVEILLDSNGTVQDVKVHHECKIEQQSCSELVNCLINGDFTDFTMQLEGLASIYQLNAEPKIKIKAFVALQALETDLSNLYMFQNIYKDPQTLIIKSAVGILQQRRGGHPMKLTYFVPPYDLLDSDTKSIIPLTVDLLNTKNIGASVTVNLEASVSNKLQIAPILTVNKDLQGRSSPIYSPMSTHNSMMLPASFVLRLNKAMPICHSLLQQMRQVTTDITQTTAETKLLPILSLIAEHESGGKLNSTVKGLFVSLPDQNHCYFMTESKHMEGSIINSVPFTEPGHVPKILNLLRQQIAFNTLIASCVRSGSKQDIENAIMFEVSAISCQHITVSLEHSYEESMATVEFILTDLNNITCRIFSLNHNYDIIANKLSIIIQKSLSIPVTLRALIKLWEQENLKNTQRNLLENGNFNLPLGPNDPGGRGGDFRDIKNIKTERNNNGNNISNNNGFNSVNNNNNSNGTNNNRSMFNQTGGNVIGGNGNNTNFTTEHNLNSMFCNTDNNNLLSQLASSSQDILNFHNNDNNNIKNPIKKRRTTTNNVEDFWKNPKSNKLNDYNNTTTSEILLEYSNNNNSSSNDSNSLGTSTTSVLSETTTTTTTGGVVTPNSQQFTCDLVDALTTTTTTSDGVGGGGGLEKSSFDGKLVNDNDNDLSLSDTDNNEIQHKKKKFKRDNSFDTSTASTSTATATTINKNNSALPSVSITPIITATTTATTLSVTQSTINSVLTGMGLERRPGIEIIPIASPTIPTSLPSSITITPINTIKTEKKSSSGSGSSSSSKQQQRSENENNKIKQEKKKKRKRASEDSSGSSSSSGGGGSSGQPRMGPPEKLPPSKQPDGLNKPVSVSIKTPDGSPVSPGLLRKFSTSPIPKIAGSNPVNSKQSPRNSPVYHHGSPKHVGGGLQSPKSSSSSSSSSPKHHTSSGSGKPSMSTLKSATNSPKSEKSSSKSSSTSSSSSSSSRDRDRDREKERDKKSNLNYSSGSSSPKLKQSTVKLKQLDIQTTSIMTSDLALLGDPNTSPGLSDANKLLASNQARNRKGSLSAVIDKLKSAQNVNDEVCPSSTTPTKTSSGNSSSSSNLSNSPKERSNNSSSSAGLTSKSEIKNNSSATTTGGGSKNSEYQVKPSSDGIKITINKTRTKDSSKSSGGGGSNQSKSHTGLKPGVNSGPASKKPQTTITINSSGKVYNPFSGLHSPNKSSIQKSNSSGNVGLTSLSKSTTPTKSSSNTNSSGGNSSNDSKRDKLKVQKSTTTTTNDRHHHHYRSDASDVMKMLGFSSTAQAREGFIKSLDTKFQIPKLSQRTSGTSSSTTSSSSSSNQDQENKKDTKNIVTTASVTTAVAVATTSTTAVTTISTTLTTTVSSTATKVSSSEITITTNTTSNVNPITSVSNSDTIITTTPTTKMLVDLLSKEIPQKNPTTFSSFNKMNSENTNITATTTTIALHQNSMTNSLPKLNSTFKSSSSLSPSASTSIHPLQQQYGGALTTDLTFTKDLHHQQQHYLHHKSKSSDGLNFFNHKTIDNKHSAPSTPTYTATTVTSFPSPVLSTNLEFLINQKSESPKLNNIFNNNNNNNNSNNNNNNNNNINNNNNNNNNNNKDDSNIIASRLMRPPSAPPSSTSSSQLLSTIPTPSSSSSPSLLSSSLLSSSLSPSISISKIPLTFENKIFPLPPPPPPPPPATSPPIITTTTTTANTISPITTTTTSLTRTKSTTPPIPITNNIQTISNDTTSSSSLSLILDYSSQSTNNQSTQQQQQQQFTKDTQLKSNNDFRTINNISPLSIPLPPPPPPPPIRKSTPPIILSASSSSSLSSSTLSSVSTVSSLQQKQQQQQQQHNFPLSPSVSLHIVKSPVPSPLMIIPSPHSNSPCITDDELMDEALVGISGK